MDRAYEGDETRQLALEPGFTPVVPPHPNRVTPWEYDRAMYCKRNEVERLFRRLKGFRRVFSRFDKLDVMFMAFKGANEEFLSAHAHYREGKYKECLNDSLKAFESTLKVICHKRRWAFKATDSAKNLIDLIFEKELIPPFLQSHFTGIRSTLESGVPTVRNKLGGHGQGAQPIDAPNYIAAYALHLTATNILLLVQADAVFGK